MPGDPEGLARYIANHPEAKGMGPTRAAKIAHPFADDFEDTLFHSPERIAEVANVPVSVIKSLRTVWMTSRRFNAVMTWLSAFGMTHYVSDWSLKCGGRWNEMLLASSRLQSQVSRLRPANSALRA